MKKIVLVVEDNEDFRNIISAALSRSGYEVDLAENGQDALFHLRRKNLPQLIVLDVRMPIMDAWQFRAEQQNDPRLRHISVVIYSNEPEIASIASKLGAIGFVSKQDGINRFVDEIDRCLSLCS